MVENTVKNIQKMGRKRRILDKVVLFPYKGARHFVLNSKDLERKETKYTNVSTGMITSTQSFVIK